jgi:hypothetical protein
MQVVLSGAEIQAALVAAAHAKLNIPVGRAETVDVSIMTGSRQFDPLNLRAIVKLSAIERRKKSREG